MSSRPADDPHRKASNRFLGTIHKNVGDPQPVLLRAHVLHQELSQSGIRLQHAHTARDAALEHGLAFRWQDAEGIVRYGLTPEGVDAVPDATMPIYEPADIDALEDVVGTENSRPEPDQDVLTTIAAHIRSVRDGGESN
jgi:hypothetical protein